jgi:branched-chain amino acid transport system substrate-binding protein
MRKSSKRLALVAVIALGALTVGVAGTAHAADPGVTDKAVTIGYLYSGTGVAGSTYKDAGKACEARVKRQNAQGGVNGRKINAIIVDDKSSGENLTATKDLIDNKHVFAIVNNSSFGFLSYRTMLENKVPMIGSGADGDYYGKPGNESIFSATGAPFGVDITVDSFARILKSLGVKKVAAVAYGASPSSANTTKLVQQYAVPSQGMEAAYTNTAVDFGSTDVGPIALGIKNSGADGAFLPLVESTNFAILQSLQQNGVKLKGMVLPTGYGQALLDSPVLSSVTPNVVFTTGTAPVELETKSTKQLQSDLKKYAGLTGVPNFGTTSGYLTCDLMILGLEHAGKTPTRDGFVAGLRKVGSWDGGGLLCGPVDISAEHYGKYPRNSCTYAVRVKDGKFVPLNHGMPIKAKLVGDPDALASLTFDNGTGATTTTTTP